MLYPPRAVSTLASSYTTPDVRILKELPIPTLTLCQASMDSKLSSIGRWRGNRYRDIPDFFTGTPAWSDLGIPRHSGPLDTAVSRFYSLSISERSLGSPILPPTYSNSKLPMYGILQIFRFLKTQCGENKRRAKQIRNTLYRRPCACGYSFLYKVNRTHQASLLG